MNEIISIKTMIDRAAAKSSVLRISLIKGAWKSITEELSLKSEPLGIKDGILYIVVENSIYLHAMRMKKKIYISRINRFLKGEYVIDIKYRAGKIDLHSKIQRGEETILINEDSTEKKIKDYKTKNMSVEESIGYLAGLAKKREEFLLKNTPYKRCRKCRRMFLGIEETCPECRGEKQSVTINRY